MSKEGQETATRCHNVIIIIMVLPNTMKFEIENRR